MYRWWVFMHIVGAFGFVLAHGASAMAALRLRRERDMERIRALLDLSSASLGAMYGSLLLLLVAGLVATFQGHWWGQGWTWTSLGVVVALVIAMYPLASDHFNRVREAVGIQTYQQAKKGIEPGPPAAPQELEAILNSPRALVTLAVGVAGLLLILWLMVLKPF